MGEPRRVSSQDCSASTISASTITCTFPAATSARNALVAVASINTTVGNISAPSGWTDLGAITTSSSTRSARLAWKLADGTETEAKFSLSAGNIGYAWASEFSALGGAPLVAVAASQHNKTAATGGFWYPNLPQTVYGTPLILSIVITAANTSLHGSSLGTVLHSAARLAVAEYETVMDAQNIAAFWAWTTSAGWANAALHLSHRNSGLGTLGVGQV